MKPKTQPAFGTPTPATPPSRPASGKPASSTPPATNTGKPPVAGEPGRWTEPPTANPLTPEELEHRRASQQASQKAEGITKGFFPMCVAMVLSAGGSAFNHFDGQAYMDRVMADYGNPEDPTLRILIEQFVIAHLRSLLLHTDAAYKTSPEMTKIVNAAAARLLAEIRRTAVAIDDMRRQTPVKPRLKIARTG